jgi:hypothetical protein
MSREPEAAPPALPNAAAAAAVRAARASVANTGARSSLPLNAARRSATLTPVVTAGAVALVCSALRTARQRCADATSDGLRLLQEPKGAEAASLAASWLGISLGCTLGRLSALRGIGGLLHANVLQLDGCDKRASADAHWQSATL